MTWLRMAMERGNAKVTLESLGRTVVATITWPNPEDGKIVGVGMSIADALDKLDSLCMEDAAATMRRDGTA